MLVCVGSVFLDSVYCLALSCSKDIKLMEMSSDDVSINNKQTYQLGQSSQRNLELRKNVWNWVIVIKTSDLSSKINYLLLLIKVNAQALCRDFCNNHRCDCIIDRLPAMYNLGNRARSR
jgi:hypothetical protein